MNRTTKYISAPIAVALVFLLGAIEDNAMLGRHSFIFNKETLAKKPYVPLQYERVKDTMYVLGDSYVEISLDEQIARLFLRNGQKHEFNISSGNPNISKGMETTPGVYTVQSKSRKAVSKQFNDAELINWVGFNGNIGFHGLVGNGYYGYLGKRPSSHGCVRIGREDGDSLYRKVKLGTPVMVYHSKPARVFAFADWNFYVSSRSILVSSNGRNFKKIFSTRLKNLYSGDVHIKNKEKIFFDGSTVLKQASFSPGDANKIADRHRLPLYETQFQSSIADNVRFGQKPKAMNDSLETELFKSSGN